MSLPSAGWYPDPQEPGRVRWWDGARWGEVAPAPTPPPSAAPSAWPTLQPETRFSAPWEPSPRPAAPSAPTALRGRRRWAEDERQARRANPASYTGLLLAVIGAIVNPLGVLGVLGIVFGAIGLSHAGRLSGQRHTGFGLALTAVLVGLAETVWFIVHFSRALAVVQSFG